MWIEATDGVLLVGEPAGADASDAHGRVIAPGRPVAVARVAVTSPGEVWLEGIRVDPRVRGMDVATGLQVAELHVAAALGATVVRYATSSRNEGSHRLGARHGFRVVCSFRTWSSGQDPDGDEDDESAYDPDARARASERRRELLARASAAGLVADAADTDALWSRVIQDEVFCRGQRLYEHRAWALQELTRRRFEDHLAGGEVLTGGPPTGDGWGLAIVPRETLPAEDVSLHLGLLVGHGRAPIALAAEIARLADDPIRFRLADHDPPIPGIARTDLESAGFTGREWLLDILARSLDAANPPPPIDPSAVVADVPELAAVNP